MDTNLNLTVRCNQACPELASDPPAWWRASRKEFDLIRDARLEIHLHDKIMARKAWFLLTGAVFAAVSIYSIDATGAMASPAESSFMLAASALLLILTAVWILDRRLTQQFRDAKLQAFVWNELVAAVKHGWIDLPLLEASASSGAEFENLLRKELAVVTQYLASQENVQLHLPLFDSGISLTKA